jgi:predicted nucleic acid-binding protein
VPTRKLKSLYLKGFVKFIYEVGIDKMKEAGMTIIDLKGSDMTQSVQHARDNGLITADAAHLAVMQRKSIHQIATEDSDFAVVPDITAWSPSGW